MSGRHPSALRPLAFCLYKMMDQVLLGSTGISVSRLCFGTLTLGPLQASLSLDAGAALLAHAISRGLNFFDTAQLYQTYPYIREALKRSGQPGVVISTKTYAHDRPLAEEALEEARRALDRDFIDIFLLHEQESEHTLRGHREALDYLLAQKARGVIGAIGLSTHHVAGVRGAIKAGLDIVHPLLNLEGLGIVDGTRAEMESAVADACQSGMGIFGMKALGGGNLFRRAEDCLTYALSLPVLHSIAVGMQSVEEVDANISFFEGKGFSPAARQALSLKKRALHIDDWCEGCGACVDRCGQGALTLEEGQAVCAHQTCLLCGYCCTVCPAWAIKIV